MDTEELKKMFIIDPKEYKSEKLEEHVQRMLKYCEVDKEGRVHLKVKFLSNKSKAKLILVARFLANKLDSNIQPSVTTDEIASALDISNDQARARASEIVRSEHATLESRGVYSIKPRIISNFLDELDSTKVS